MGKVLYTIKTEVKMAPVVYMEMVANRRNAGAIRSKKDYNRKEKHRGSRIRKEMEV